MRKTLLIVLSTGVLFAQNNIISDNNINTGGGSVNIQQSNNQVSKEEISINRKIDDERMKVMSLENTQEKSMITILLNQAKEINRQQIPLQEKNRECKFKAELGAKVMKFVNLQLSFSYCDKIF